MILLEVARKLSLFAKWPIGQKYLDRAGLRFLEMQLLHVKPLMGKTRCREQNCTFRRYTTVLTPE